MKSMVVYESMYGNSHVVADRFAIGLRVFGKVSVVPVCDATADSLAGVDLVVVGGPTHVHGMSSERSRRAAVETATKPGSVLRLDAGAHGAGLREWLDSLDDGNQRAAAAFDTRSGGPVLLTGKASKAIARRLERRNFRVVDKPTSFIVQRDNTLAEGAEIAARLWGESIGRTVSIGMSLTQPSK